MPSDEEELIALLRAIRELMLLGERFQSLPSIVEWIGQQPTGRLTKQVYSEEYSRPIDWYIKKPEPVPHKRTGPANHPSYSHPAAQSGLFVASLLGAWFLPHFYFRVVLCAIGVASILWFLWDKLPLGVWWTIPRRLVAAFVVGVIVFAPLCYAIKGASETLPVVGDVSSATPSPNPSPTAMVRDFGASRPANFTDTSNGNIPEQLYFYTTVCFANFGNEDTNVQAYGKGGVISRSASPAEVHRMIEGFKDDIAAAIPGDKAAVEAYPAYEEPAEYLGDCDPPKALHPFSFMTKITLRQFFDLKEKLDEFLYIGRLVERNAQGTTYWDVCGVSVSRSLPIRCPEAGSK